MTSLFSFTEVRMKKSAAEEFVDLVAARIQAGCQVMFVPTGGQLRLTLKLLYRAAKKAGLGVLAEWDSVRGLEYHAFGKTEDEDAHGTIQNLNVPSSLLAHLVSGTALSKPSVLLRGDKPKRRGHEDEEDAELAEEDPDEIPSGLIVAHDLFAFLAPMPTLATSLKRYVVETGFNSGTHRFPLIVVGTLDQVPPTLAPYIVRVDLPYPELPEVAEAIGELFDNAGNEAIRAATAERRNEVAHLCLGMTLPDAIETVCTALVMTKKVDDGTMRLIEKEKAKIIRNVPGLSHVSRDDVRNTEIGGYEVLKEWCEEQRDAFNGKAAGKLDQPKGTLFIGSPGTGKSAAGRMVAKVFNLPLYMLDVSSVMAGVVGESERQMREALNAVSANRECVLLLDEIDKAMGGAHKTSGDSGVAKRMLGSLLTWMNDKKEKIFVVMTANRNDDLPPELLRPGRLDEIFFVDLPNKTERKAIFEIHLRKRGVEVVKDLSPVIEATHDFSGAEIERAVSAAMKRKAARNREWDGGVLTIDELVASATLVRPIAGIDPVSVDAIRDFGKKFLTSASRPEGNGKTKVPSVRKLRTDDDPSRN